MRTSEIPPSLFNTHFTLLHKGGNVHDVQNCRPIANLNITYRILARLVFNRISRSLDSHQSEDQFGFRRKRSCAHALFVLESMISTGIEFNVPVWIISIDLKKAFDRIEHHALFRALREQEMDPEIIALLERLYSDQHGAVGNYRFRISRGVRRGDVVLEHAIRKWKTSLLTEGFALTPNPFGRSCIDVGEFGRCVKIVWLGFEYEESKDYEHSSRIRRKHCMYHKTWSCRYLGY